tara:strand:+ start:72 stop:983 length:912 start_codon:yes stop_codon:yes gene_type:complete
MDRAEQDAYNQLAGSLDARTEALKGIAQEEATARKKDIEGITEGAGFGALVPSSLGVLKYGSGRLLKVADKVAPQTAGEIRDLGKGIKFESLSDDSRTFLNNATRRIFVSKRGGGTLTDLASKKVSSIKGLSTQDPFKTGNLDADIRSDVFNGKLSTTDAIVKQQMRTATPISRPPITDVNPPALTRDSSAVNQATQKQAGQFQDRLGQLGSSGDNVDLNAPKSLAPPKSVGGLSSDVDTAVETSGKIAGEEAGEGVLDAIPGGDIVGAILGLATLFGGISEADKVKPAPPPPTIQASYQLGV